MKHWLYSLCCTIHPCSLTPRSLYLPLPSPYMPFPRPPHWQPLVCSLYPTGSTSRTKLNDNLIREMNNYIYIYTFFFFFYLFAVGCAGSSLLRGLCLDAASRGSSPIVVRRLLITVASLVAERGH